MLYLHSLSHLLVDALCAATLFGPVVSGGGDYATLSLLYSTLAFATQCLVGLAADRLGRKTPVLAAAMALGVLLCYAFGTAWFVLVYAGRSGPIGVGTALAWCVLPYLIPDGVKIALAAMLTGRLRPLLYREGRSE